MADAIPLPASDRLKEAVRKLTMAKGQLYAEIPHPDFADWPSSRLTITRRRIIEPHLEYAGGKALEIGAYLATFSHWLCDLGYDVTAVERRPEYVAIAREIRNLCGKRFEIIEGQFKDLPAASYDVVLALSVFHHALKRPRPFAVFDSFLSRLDCKMIIFESHDPGEHHMVDAYRPMEPLQFAEFIARKTGLSCIEEIGMDGVRRIFKLKR